MKLIEDCYKEMFINESLKRILPALTVDKIMKDLKVSYDEYYTKHPKLPKYKNYQYYDSDEPQGIYDTLIEVQQLDKSYEMLFKEFETNKKVLTRVLGVDQRWEQFFRQWNQFKLEAPAKLLLIKYLQKMGLNIPVVVNQDGWPIYSFHLLSLFLQIKTITELKANNIISHNTAIDLFEYVNEKIDKKGVKKELDTFLKDAQKTSGIPTTDVSNIPKRAPLSDEEKQAKIEAFIKKQQEQSRLNSPKLPTI